MISNINISSIKSKFEYEEIFTDDEKKTIKLKRNASMRDSIQFAELFVSAYYTFENNLYMITDEGFIAFMKELKQKADGLRFGLEDLNSTEINTYFKKLKVIDIIDREPMNNLIGYFFQVFILGGTFG